MRPCSRAAAPEASASYSPATPVFLSQASHERALTRTKIELPAGGPMAFDIIDTRLKSWTVHSSLCVPGPFPSPV